MNKEMKWKIKKGQENNKKEYFYGNIKKGHGKKTIKSKES